MKRFAMLSVAALCAAAGAARAATLTVTDPFSIDTTSAPGAPSSVTLSFAQFNAGLGTLTGVNVALTGAADAVLSFVNNSPTVITFSNGTSSTSLQLSGAGLATASSATLTSAVASGQINGSAASPGFAYTYFDGTAAPVNLGGAVAGASLAAYLGSGTDTLSAAFGAGPSSASFASPGPPLFAGVGGGGQASGNVTITYTYTPVPLPAALWLLLSALGGLGAMFERRSSAA
jgi:hypothetical protein